MSHQNTISDLGAIEDALVAKANAIERLEREVQPSEPGAAFALRAAHALALAGGDKPCRTGSRTLINAPPREAVRKATGLRRSQPGCR